LRRDGRIVCGPEDDADERRCGKCGLTLNFPGDVCPRCIDRGAVLGRVWELLKPYRVPTLWMCLLIFLGVATELAPPKLQQYLVDHVLRTEDRTAELVAVLITIVGALAGTRVLLSVVNAVKGALANRVGTAMTSDLRAKLVEKLQAASVDFYDR